MSCKALFEVAASGTLSGNWDKLIIYALVSEKVKKGKRNSFADRNQSSRLP